MFIFTNKVSLSYVFRLDNLICIFKFNLSVLTLCFNFQCFTSLNIYINVFISTANMFSCSDLISEASTPLPPPPPRPPFLQKKKRLKTKKRKIFFFKSNNTKQKRMFLYSSIFFFACIFGLLKKYTPSYLLEMVETLSALFNLIYISNENTNVYLQHSRFLTPPKSVLKFKKKKTFCLCGKTVLT